MQTIRSIRRLPRALVVLCAVLLLPGSARALAPDVEPGAWYEAAVTEMWQQGVLAGYPDGTFRPNRTITAAEYLTVLARLTGLDPVPAQSGHWAAGQIEAVRQQGWYDWDELPPTGEGFDWPISRKLAVKVTMNAFYPGARGDYATESVKIRDFRDLDGRYYEPVLAAYAVGLAAGDEQGNFRPDSGLTRAEACMLLCRAWTADDLTDSGRFVFSHFSE